MTALTFADECNDLTLTLLQLRVELIGLRRDLMKRGGAADLWPNTAPISRAFLPAILTVGNGATEAAAPFL